MFSKLFKLNSKVRIGIGIGIIYYGSAWFLSHFFPTKLKYHPGNIFGEEWMWKWLKGRTVTVKDFKELTNNKKLFIVLEHDNSMIKFYKKKIYYSDRNWREKYFVGYNSYKDSDKIDNYSDSTVTLDSGSFNIIDSTLRCFYIYNSHETSIPISDTTKFASIEPVNEIKIIKNGLYSAKKIKIDKVYKIYEHPWIKSNLDTILNIWEYRNLYKYIDYTYELIEKVDNYDRVLDISRISVCMWEKILKFRPNFHIYKEDYIKLDTKVKNILLKNGNHKHLLKTKNDFMIYNDNIDILKKDLLNSEKKIFPHLNDDCLKKIGSDWVYENFDKLYKKIPMKFAEENGSNEAYLNIVDKVGKKFNLTYVPKKFHTVELYEKILDILKYKKTSGKKIEYDYNKKFLENIDFDLVDEEFCVDLVSKINKAIFYIPKEKRTKMIIINSINSHKNDNSYNIIDLYNTLTPEECDDLDIKEALN